MSLGMELLDHRFCMCLTLVNIAKYFLKWLYQFPFPRALYKSRVAVCGRKNNAHTCLPAQNDVHILIPGTCEYVTLCGKRTLQL